MNTAQNLSYTESQLVEALCYKEEQAMSFLYDKYNKALFTIIYRIVNNQEMSEDVLQECFVKIWNNISNYDSSKGSLFTWMLNICRNGAIDKLRSKEFKSVAKNQNFETSVNVSNHLTEFNPDTLGLKAITEKLKSEQREVLDLVYFNGYTHAETAEELDLPLGTVKTRLRLAILELRTYFK